jgi:hypothetical protein
MLEVMVDLETLGTNNDAVIVAIGAVKFDPTNLDAPMQNFYCTINPESAVACGQKIDAATMLWWMHSKRNDARLQLFEEPKEMLSLPTALEGFALWFGGESVPVWGNGATFDNVILRSAYRLLGLDAPWMFWHDRCYRTMKNLAPLICVDTPFERVGTHHNALDDATSQALHLQRILKGALGETEVAGAMAHV